MPPLYLNEKYSELLSRRALTCSSSLAPNDKWKALFIQVNVPVLNEAALHRRIWLDVSGLADSTESRPQSENQARQSAPEFGLAKRFELLQLLERSGNYLRPLLSFFRSGRFGTTSTGQLAWRTMCSAVLPMKTRRRPERPCVDVMIKSTSSFVT